MKSLRIFKSYRDLEKKIVLQLAETQRLLDQSESERIDFEAQIRANAEDIVYLKGDIEARQKTFDTQITARTEEIAELKRGIEARQIDFEAQIRAKAEDILYLKGDIEARKKTFDTQITARTDEIAELKRGIEARQIDFEAQIRAKAEDIEYLKGDIEARKKDFDEQIAAKISEITELKYDINTQKNALETQISVSSGESISLRDQLNKEQLILDSLVAAQSRGKNATPRIKVTPFVLNSNLPHANPGTYAQMMHEIVGNTGNTYITYSMLKTLGYGPSLRKQQHVRNIWEDALPDVEYVNSNYTHCLLTLQDQFQASLPEYIPTSQLVRLTEFIGKLRIPLVAYSLGTNFAPSDTGRRICDELMPLLLAIAEKCPAIGIRGEITREALAKAGVHNTTVIGCPTYFENGFGRTLSKNLLRPTDAILGTGLFSTNAPNPVHFLAQSESMGMKLSCGGDLSPVDISEFLAAATCYPGYGHTFLNALKHGRVRAFCDMDAWKRYIVEANIRIAIGTRLHGSILAINSGVPALCTAGDTRAKETCEYLGIPHRPGFCGLDLDPSEVLAHYDLEALNQRYNETHAQYLLWLEANGL